MLPKGVGQVILVDVDQCGQLVQGEVFLKMVVNISAENVMRPGKPVDA